VRHAFFSSPRPLVFAHRGGAALAPENTLDAFDNGLALGADGIELDVRLSRDGVVVVIEAGDKGEVLAKNDLGEPIVASPALVAGKLYVRTEGKLYAFR